MIGDKEMWSRISKLVARDELRTPDETLHQMAQQLVSREEALIESERKYREIIDASKDALFLNDFASGKIVEANRAVEDMLGYSRDELLHYTVQNMSSGETPYSLEEVFQLMRKNYDAGTLSFESSFKRKSGECIWVEVVLSPTKTGGNGRVLAVMRDITDLKNTEDMLREKSESVLRTYEAQSAIYFLNQQAQSTNNLNEVIGKALNIVLAIPWLSLVPRGSIFLANEEGTSLVMIVQRGLGTHRQEECAVVPFGTCLCGRAAMSGQIEYADTIDTRHESRAENAYPHGHYCIPIKHKNTVLGVINISLKAGHVRNQQQEEFLISYADVLAGIIQRIRAEEEQRKLVSLVEMSSDFIGIFSLEGNVLYLNNAALNIVGLTHIDQVLTKNIFDFFPKSHIEQVSDSMCPSLADNGVWRAESKLHNFQTGDSIDVDITAFIIRDPHRNVPLCMATVTRNITERKKYEEQLIYQANYDTLTGLPNRNHLNELFNQAISDRKRKKNIAALLLIDVDNFKLVNDTFGHAAGDVLLQEVANRLRGTLRDIDMVARWGGDEFVVIPGNLSKNKDVASVAELILSVLSQPFSVDEREIFLSASIGIVIYPEDGDSLDILLKHADVAMYNAKHLGKNNYKFFTAELVKRIHERLAMETRLRRALERNEYTLLYQPLLDVKTGRVVGMEALLRWQPEGQEMILPDTFISLLEETGLIIPVGEWVLRNSCRQLKEWCQSGHNLRLSVNISARQFHASNIVKRLISIVHDSGCTPDQICLELTESIIMQDAKETIKKLEFLTKVGFSLAIDDFGMGFSSLNYLKRLPISELKIDKSFISGLPASMDDAAIVNTIIAMANNLRLSVIAEGIETKEQLCFLSQTDCNIVQGFYLGKPAYPGQLDLMLANQRI